MRFFIFFFLIAAYMVIGLIGIFPHGFIQSHSFSRYYDKHVLMIILLLLLISIFFTWLFWHAIKDFYWLAQKNVDETRKARVSGTVFFGMIFFVFSFLYRTSHLSFYNSLGHSEKISVNGTVTNEWIVYGTGRSHQRTYFLDIADSFGHINEFVVSDYVYKRSKIGDQINKSFSIGKLGVLYRREEE